MPLNQLLMHVANCSNIYFNLSLFQYLDKHTIQNIGKSYIHTYIHIINNIVALRPIDRKKNRKRNLISANVGLLMLGFMLVNVTIQCNLHIWELNLGSVDNLDITFRIYIFSRTPTIHHKHHLRPCYVHHHTLGGLLQRSRGQASVLQMGT